MVTCVCVRIFFSFYIVFHTTLGHGAHHLLSTVWWWVFDSTSHISTLALHLLSLPSDMPDQHGQRCFPCTKRLAYGYSAFGVGSYTFYSSTTHNADRKNVCPDATAYGYGEIEHENRFMVRFSGRLAFHFTGRNLEACVKAINSGDQTETFLTKQK